MPGRYSASSLARVDEPSHDEELELPLSITQRSLHAVATGIGACGLVVIAAAFAPFVRDSFTFERAVVLALLTIATVVCTRFPIRIGVSDGYMTLTSVPLVLAAVLLPWHDSVLIAFVGIISVVVADPGEGGWTGWFWRIQYISASGLVMGSASLASQLLGVEAHLAPVRILPALIVAAVMEGANDANYLVEMEARGMSGREAFMTFGGRVSMAASVFLPAIATAVLTPYVGHLVIFSILFPLLLLSICGALWVANSHQLEKYRGERLRDTFSRYVPEGVVANNIETMQAVELGGEQRQISVLFCDIRGFTSWAESRGATEVITELNVLLTELSASVMEFSGTLDKFTGDGLMAFWGAPVPTEDHANLACRAALDMLLRLDEVNARRLADGQEPFAIGVGVHSGDAVVGNVGHERRLDYTAIGDTVNTAARLEAATKDIGKLLLISRRTVDSLSGELFERAMLVGDISVKGKQQPVEAWAIPPLRRGIDELPELGVDMDDAEESSAA
jgi:class 3 adenylate cyclase